MTETEFQEIQNLVTQGVSIRRATATGARKIQYLRMRKKKGLAPTAPAPPAPQETVAAVIREATIAANIEPTQPQPAHIVIPQVDLSNLPPVDTRELLEMAKRFLYEQLAHARFLAPAWVKLVFALCEKELPEWSNRNAKAAKDEYQSVLESVMRKSEGFHILERKEDEQETSAGTGLTETEKK